MARQAVRRTRVDGIVQRYHVTVPTAPQPSPPLPALPVTVTLATATGQTRTVQAGDLKAASWLLTQGNCHSLAAALHEATGYPIVGFYSTDTFYIDDDGDTDGHLCHLGVLAPDGWVLDGHGAMRLDMVTGRTGWKAEVLDGYGTAQLQDLIAFEENEYDRTWQPLDTALVASFVRPVLDCYARRGK